MEEAPVEFGDETPTIKEQAAKRGWKSEIWSFNKADQPGVEMFNPGLVRRPDGLWLLVRRSEQVQGLPYGMNRIWACKLVGDDEKTPHGGPCLNFPNSKQAEQFEDPRAVHWNGQTWVAACNFTWFPGDGSWWTGAHQCLGIFRDDEEWSAIARRDPIVGTNKGFAGHTHGKNNKNFIWFFLDGKLHLIFTSEPWLVVEFGAKWEDQIHHIGEGVKWKYGLVRGGTPPVQVDDLFYTFFHSSLNWRGRYRRYFMGALAFEAKPPFTPVLWTQEPLLIGSQNDPWQQGKPLVVFPCGSILEKGMWTISLGVNDLKCAWIEIPHADILNLLKPIPVIQASLLLSEKTPEPVYEKIPFEEDLSGRQEIGLPTDSSIVATNKEPVQSGGHVPPAQNKLPVPVLVDGVSRFVTDKSHDEAGESTTTRPTPEGVAERPAIDGHSPGGQFISEEPKRKPGRPRIDLRPLPGESAEDWSARLERERLARKPKRKYRKRRKKRLKLIA